MPRVEPDVVVKSGPTAEERAAVTITAAAKGHAARKQVKEMKEKAAVTRRVEAQRRETAATKIASVAKGRAVRKQVSSMRLKAEEDAKTAALAKQRAEEAAFAEELRLAKEAQLRAAQEAADAAIREAILREKNESEAKAELTRKTAELNEEITSLQAGLRERDRQLQRLKSDMSSQLTLMTKKDATIEELLLRVKELEAEVVHCKELVKLAEDDVSDGKKREADLRDKIKAMMKPPTAVSAVFLPCCVCLVGLVRWG